MVPQKIIPRVYEDGDEKEAEFNSANLCFRIIAEVSLQKSNASDLQISKRCTMVVGEKTGTVIVAVGSDLHASIARDFLANEKIDGSSKTRKHVSLRSVAIKTDEDDDAEDLEVINMCLSPDESLVACVCQRTNKQIKLLLVDVPTVIKGCSTDREKYMMKNRMTYTESVGTSALDALSCPALPSKFRKTLSAGIRDICFDTRDTYQDNEYILHAITTAGTLINIHFSLEFSAEEPEDEYQGYLPVCRVVEEEYCCEDFVPQSPDSGSSMRLTCISMSSSGTFIAVGVAHPNGLLVLKTVGDQSERYSQKVVMFLQLHDVDGDVESVNWNRENSIIIGTTSNEEDCPVLIVTCEGSLWDSTDTILKFTKTVAACSGLDASSFISENNESEEDRSETCYCRPLILSAAIQHWGLEVVANRLSTENHLNLVHFTLDEGGSSTIVELEIEDDKFAARMPESENDAPSFVAGIGIAKVWPETTRLVDVNGRLHTNGVILMYVARHDGTFFVAIFESLDFDTFGQTNFGVEFEDTRDYCRISEPLSADWNDASKRAEQAKRRNEDEAKAQLQLEEKPHRHGDESEGDSEVEFGNTHTTYEEGQELNNSNMSQQILNVENVSSSIKDAMSDCFTKANHSTASTSEGSISKQMMINAQSSSVQKKVDPFSSGKPSSPVEDVKVLQSKPTVAPSENNTINLSIHEFSNPQESTSRQSTGKSNASLSTSSSTKSTKAVYPTMMATMTPKQIQDRMSKTKAVPSLFHSDKSTMSETSSSLSSLSKNTKATASVYPTMMATMSPKEMQNHMLKSKSNSSSALPDKPLTTTKLSSPSSSPSSYPLSSSPPSLSSSLPSLSVSKSTKPTKATYPTMMATMSQKEIQDRLSKKTPIPSASPPAKSMLKSQGVLAGDATKKQSTSSLANQKGIELQNESVSCGLKNVPSQSHDDNERLRMDERLSHVYDYNEKDVTMSFKELLDELLEIEKNVNDIISSLALDSEDLSKSGLSKQDEQIVEFASDINELREATVSAFNSIDHMKSLNSNITRQYLKLQNKSEFYNDHQNGDSMNAKLSEECLNTLMVEKETILERTTTIENYLRNCNRSNGNSKVVTPKLLIDSVNNIRSHAKRQLSTINGMKESIPVEEEFRSTSNFDQLENRKSDSPNKVKKKTKQERKAVLFKLLKEARSEVSSKYTPKKSGHETHNMKVNNINNAIWSGSKERWSSIMKDLNDVYSEKGNLDRYSSSSNLKIVESLENDKFGGDNVMQKATIQIGNVANPLLSPKHRHDPLFDRNDGKERNLFEGKREMVSEPSHQFQLSLGNIGTSDFGDEKNECKNSSKTSDVSQKHIIRAKATESAQDVSATNLVSPGRTIDNNRSATSSIRDGHANSSDDSGGKLQVLSFSTKTDTSFKSNDLSSMSSNFSLLSSLKEEETENDIQSDDVATQHPRSAPLFAVSKIENEDATNSKDFGSMSVQGLEDRGSDKLPNTNRTHSDPVTTTDLAFGQTNVSSTYKDISSNSFKSPNTTFARNTENVMVSSVNQMPPIIGDFSKSSTDKGFETLTPGNGGKSPDKGVFGQGSSPSFKTGQIGFGQASSPGTYSAFGQPSSLGTSASPYAVNSSSIDSTAFGANHAALQTASKTPGFGQISQMGTQAGFGSLMQGTSTTGAFGGPTPSFGMVSGQQSFKSVSQNGFQVTSSQSGSTGAGSFGFGGFASSALAAGSTSSGFGGFGSGLGSFNISLPTTQTGSQWEMRDGKRK